MIKMQEALKEHLTDPQWEVDETSAVSFSAGYQAAIADVKAGGVQSTTDKHGRTVGPLYKLPEDV